MRRRLPDSEMAPPEWLTVIRPGVVHIDRLGLELGAESKSTPHIEEERRAKKRCGRPLGTKDGREGPGREEAMTRRP
jgi:hypothetical protein